MTTRLQSLDLCKNYKGENESFIVKIVLTDSISHKGIMKNMWSNFLMLVKSDIMVTKYKIKFLLSSLPQFTLEFERIDWYCIVLSDNTIEFFCNTIVKHNRAFYWSKCIRNAKKCTGKWAPPTSWEARDVAQHAFICNLSYRVVDPYGAHILCKRPKFYKIFVKWFYTLNVTVYTYMYTCR
jgi:hypothetical protein